MNRLIAAVGLSFTLLLGSCESVRYVKSELSGTAKPEGGTQEVVPPSRVYSATPQALRRAVLAVLNELDYVYDDQSPNGPIKTEPKSLTDTSKFAFTGAAYHAKLFITFDESKVTFRAKFDKRSNLTTPELNVDFPEKENELRRDFFAALDKKVMPAAGVQGPATTATSPAPAARPDAGSRSAPAAAAAPATAVQARPAAAGGQPHRLTKELIAKAQLRLKELGFDPGGADGSLGPRSKAAIRRFQTAHKLAVTGDLTPETLDELGISGQ